MSHDEPICDDEPIWRCIHVSQLCADGELRAASAAFVDTDRFSVYLARYANLGRIIEHFAASCVAELLVGDLTSEGFCVVRTPSEQLDEPHADVIAPAGFSVSRLTKIAKRCIVPKTKLIYVHIASAKTKV